jgi:hypothetical protein
MRIDVLENGAWVRTVGLDVDFQTPVAMTYDVPSLDALAPSLASPVLMDG